ncbi:unnamed protein product [Durusdinium trenchii]|uniref:Uncharacterized protein n=1 Tax=Durusdinium trenchii TaxID=1381693 RepID=A0ABP0PRP6_9DINO
MSRRYADDESRFASKQREIIDVSPTPSAPPAVLTEALIANLNSTQRVCLEDLQGEICAMELSEEVKERILQEEQRSLLSGSHGLEVVNRLHVAPFPPDTLGDQTPLVGGALRPMRTPEQSLKRSPERRTRATDRRRGGDESLTSWSDSSQGLPLAPAASLLPAPSAVSTAQESVVLTAVFGSWKPVQKQL